MTLLAAFNVTHGKGVEGLQQLLSTFQILIQLSFFIKLKIEKIIGYYYRKYTNLVHTKKVIIFEVCTIIRIKKIFYQKQFALN